MQIETIIRPTKSYSFPNFREMWRYRDLLGVMIWRDFSSRFRQTILGPLWFLIQPLLTTIVFTVIFGKVAGLSTNGQPEFLFYLSGVIAWSYFSSCYSSAASTLSGNMGLFSKVYFPRLLVPLSSTVSSGFTLVIQFITFFAFFLYFKTTGAKDTFHLSAFVFLVPVLVVYLALMGVAFGLWMTVITAKYRDLTQLSGIIIQLWMYASSVVIPLSVVVERYPKLVWLMHLNPVTFPVEAMRYMLLGSATVTLEGFLLSLTSTTVVLVSGLLVFSKVEKTFVDIA